MKFYNKIRGKLPEILGIPDQTLPGVPIIEIFGDTRVLIEGRCTVVQYDITCIRLQNTCGTVCVTGNGLKMAELSMMQTIITGCIDNVSIFKG